METRDLRVPARSGELRLAASRCSRILRLGELGNWELLETPGVEICSSNIYGRMFQSSSQWPIQSHSPKYVKPQSRTYQRMVYIGSYMFYPAFLVILGVYTVSSAPVLFQ